MPAATTTTALVNPHCRAMKRHLIVWAGIGLCCIHDYSRDEKREPRSFTQPLEIVGQYGEEAA